MGYFGEVKQRPDGGVTGHVGTENIGIAFEVYFDKGSGKDVVKVWETNGVTESDPKEVKADIATIQDLTAAVK